MKEPKLKQIQFKRWELRKEILKIILLSMISGSSIRKPILPLLVKFIINKLKEDMKLNIEEKKVRRVLDSLEKNDIISLAEEGDSVYVQSVNQDNPIVIKYSIRALLDFKKNKKEWQGKWYMVFFDVPEIQRNKRNYLRNFLTKLGFYPYQKSVYVFPYECEEEIKLIKNIVEGAKYMKYIVADKIEDEVILKTYFHL